MSHIRPARPDEAAEISALAMRSKAHWGYTDEQMEIFRDELTLTPTEIEKDEAFVVESDGAVVGFYTSCDHGEGNVEVGHLFVDPSALRRGFGTALMDHLTAAARAAGAGRLVVMSDPNAEGFYRSRGGRLVMHMPTSIPGRTLPLLEIPL